jgi:hypothetical protein
LLWRVHAVEAAIPNSAHHGRNNGTYQNGQVTRFGANYMAGTSFDLADYTLFAGR